jgi:hypothetical protein
MFELIIIIVAYFYQLFNKKVTLMHFKQLDCINIEK